MTPVAKKRFFVQNFGCRATQADGAGLAADLTGRGMDAAADAAAADIVVLNTCTVTSEADQDARQTIRRIHRENPGAEILVTGCYAQRRPEELSGLPGVHWVVGNSHKSLIGDVLCDSRGREAGAANGFVQIQAAPESLLDYHGEISPGGILVGDISRQTAFLAAPVFDAGFDRTRPNLKIQDGCGNRCTFCVIPSVRGPSRSADPEAVIEQVRALSQRYAEIVITGINLGRWGRELDGRPRLAGLLRRILAETAVSRLRLSSVEPMDWSSELLDLMASNDRIAEHVHIPLQSGSDAVLKAMRRRYRTRHYADRLHQARQRMPFAAIGADVMVGFPGETSANFEETRAFIQQMPFTYLHVFTYSQREGTPAAMMPDQVPKAIKKERNRVLRELIAEKNLAFRRSLAGRRLSAVTLDGRPGKGALALTGNFVPVEIEGPAIEAGRFVEIAIRGVDGEKTFAALA